MRPHKLKAVVTYTSGNRSLSSLSVQDDALEEAAFEDVGAICVRRHKLEAWVTKPFLERTLPGCLLRLSLGERTNSSGVLAPCYMLAQARHCYSFMSGIQFQGVICNVWLS